MVSIIALYAIACGAANAAAQHSDVPRVSMARLIVVPDDVADRIIAAMKTTTQRAESNDSSRSRRVIRRSANAISV